MSKNIQRDLEELIQEISTESDENTDFTFSEHYKERIAYHIDMLKYYFDEQRKL